MIWFEILGFALSGGIVGGFVAWRFPRVIMQYVNVPLDTSVEMETEGDAHIHDWHVKGTDVKNGRKRVLLYCSSCDGAASRKVT